MFQTVQVIKTNKPAKLSDVDPEWDKNQQRKDKRNKINRRKGRNSKRNWEV